MDPIIPIVAITIIIVLVLANWNTFIECFNAAIEGGRKGSVIGARAINPGAYPGYRVVSRQEHLNERMAKAFLGRVLEITSSYGVNLQEVYLVDDSYHSLEYFQGVDRLFTLTRENRLSLFWLCSQKEGYLLGLIYNADSSYTVLPPRY